MEHMEFSMHECEMRQSGNLEGEVGMGDFDALLVSVSQEGQAGLHLGPGLQGAHPYAQFPQHSLLLHHATPATTFCSSTWGHNVQRVAARYSLYLVLIGPQLSRAHRTMSIQSLSGHVLDLAHGRHMDSPYIVIVTLVSLELGSESNCTCDG